MCDDGSSEFLRLLASNFGTAALDGKNEVLDTKDPLLNRGMKTLKCPKCNWHYKYHETLEIHMKEKHAQSEVACVYCNDNVQHPKLARGETYSCGYKPYRCELCKYSTTTKGNLSIHMQSDKHLHALNELPANIASLQSVATFAQTASTNERLFKCVLCNYACDAVDEMVAHMDKDRSRPAAGDVLLLNGTFRCQLCPYTTNLKANFQLHTRTDKHLQRVQLVNHIRERTSSAPVALSAVKSSLCVLCRVCDQVLSSVNCLREHVSSLQHNANLRQTATLSCRLCSFETSLMSEAIGHLCNHEAVTWPHDRLAKMNVSMEDDAAYACASCGFATKDAKSLEEHAMTHEEGELCPLCPQRTQQLCEHLVQDHKIAESAVERLLATQKDTSTYAFRCEDCSMAFRSQESLQMHQVAHLFQTTHKCTHCAFEASDAQTLQAHVETHESQRCQLCRQTFSTTQLFVEHLNSVAHLHRAKQQLEQNAADLSSQCLSLQNAASPSEFSKPFRCNVCNIGYAQGATLDIHLRSVAHQSRMSKLGELVATGEVDSSRPVLEQPAGPAQRLIREVIAEDDEPKVTDSSALTMLNVMNMLMSGTNNNEAATSNNSDDSPTDFKSQLDSFGIDRVCEACPELREFVHDLWRLSKEQCEDLVNVTCDLCSTTVELQQLQQHHEETHAAAPSTRCLAALGTRIVSVLGQPAATNEPAAKRARTQNEADFSQMAMLNMMGNSFPFMGINHMAFEQFFNPLMHQIHNSQSPSPAKRARTRITDDQLKILRQYFDINNSPSEAQIKEMSEKAALPEKVIKHWFRNTLFKERQRDKDSPYNFSVPPQMGIDLATYEKTGETKVVELTPELNDSNVELQMKVKCDSSREKKPSIVDTSPLQQMMQQMSNSAMHLFDSSLMPAALNVSSTSARRANRTRFTDSQLRTLQNFFEKQAYPKDDDLEALSKKLQLNPRVIVVWFQNQRQKARKVYENQPNHENGERFARTPECNFQCKRCNVVFQRYYELIQHQQSKCYKDDGDAQARDNKMLDVTLADEEKSRSSQERTTVEVKPSVEVKPPTNDLARLFADSSTEALLKMCESVGQSTSAQKECPFCGVLCETTSLLQHMLTEHMQKEFSNDGALDLSTNSLDVGESLSVSPFERGLDSDVDCDEPTTATSATAASSLSAASPAIKRYRTHLTPTQVHVMKRIFAFYKTPSMSECEALGREVSLHKRVVQVWFQNSRAKHRKQVPVNEALEEESSSTFCALCNVQYNARNTMQDHIFSSAHIGQLKAQLNNFSNGEENNVDKSKKISKSERSPSMNAFNFEMMLPQALPLLYDATLMQGTSVELLQIPDSVKRQIRSDMDSGQTSTTFTQDGLSIEQAQKMLGDLAPMMSDSQRQVGWACSQCSKVLQSSPLLSAHQHTVCRVGGEFGLHQVHYDCRKCNASFGRVLELRTHLESCTERLASA